MRNICLARLLPVAGLLVAGAYTPAAGQMGQVLEGRTFQSEALGREWVYSIYLPPGYEDSERAYPVIYNLHGLGGDHAGLFRYGNAASIADSLISTGLVPPVILVSADGSRSFWVNSDPDSGFGPVETALVQDLVGHVNQTYTTITARRGRMLVGFSMGGYGALHTAFKYPELFGAVAALSPAINREPVAGGPPSPAFGNPFDPSRYAEENPFTLLRAFVDHGPDLPLPVYLAAGDADFESWLMEGTMDFHLDLFEAQLPSELRIMDGGHNMTLWQSTFPGALVFLAGAFQGTLP